jgi:excisionase family DNA binding protein
VPAERPSGDSLPSYITRLEAAEYARVSIDTIDRAIKVGDLVAQHPRGCGRGRPVRIRRADFYKWLGLLLLVVLACVARVSL